MGLAERRARHRGSTQRKNWFQSARQIWVWPNAIAQSPRFRLHSVSICQADLGLAEPQARSNGISLLAAFQSARQIWVWPNYQAEKAVHMVEGCFNLPGRFGFGRTESMLLRRQVVYQFQSARQIWVWPNFVKALITSSVDDGVSICQADLGLAERDVFFLSNGFFFNVSICQADLGLAEQQLNYVKDKAQWVSICQADLGLAEHVFFSSEGNQLGSSFNLPGRFGFGRTCHRHVRGSSDTSFNLPGRFGFGRTIVLNRLWVDHPVSICQADLGLAEQRPGLRFHRHPRRFNLPGRFGFGRTPGVRTFALGAHRFNLPGRFGFGRTCAACQQPAGKLRVSICQADLGLAERYRQICPYQESATFQSARQIWVWPNGMSRVGT